VTERRAIRAATAAGLAVAALAVALAGCGLDVQQADLFLLTRTGQGPKLTLLPNDSGTIRCDGGKARTLPDALLIEARDLAQDLDNDARRGLTIKPMPGTVFSMGRSRFPIAPRAPTRSCRRPRCSPPRPRSAPAACPDERQMNVVAVGRLLIREGGYAGRRAPHCSRT
jgi:hypothetical protein